MHPNVHSSIIYSSQVLEATKVPISKWMDEKTLVHLHNGILHRREKEGAYTLCNSMDGTGEHYAKWNKPGHERQIPYDLTYKWNLINKTTRDSEIKNKLTVTRGEERGGSGRTKRRVKSRNMYKGHMDNAKGGWDWWWEVGLGLAGESSGGQMETTVLEQQIKINK